MPKCVDSVQRSGGYVMAGRCWAQGNPEKQSKLLRLATAWDIRLRSTYLASIVASYACALVSCRRTCHPVHSPSTFSQTRWSSRVRALNRDPFTSSTGRGPLSLLGPNVAPSTALHFDLRSGALPEEYPKIALVSCNCQATALQQLCGREQST